MSIVPKETIEVIAQSIGINNLSPDVTLALAPDVEYRLREIMQEAIKCMRHSKRTILTADDVDSALSLRNVEPIYGFASGDPLRFKRAVGHKDLFYIDDKDVEFKDVIEAPLPKAPLDTAVVAHWLAIEGVQPAIPENAPVEALVAPPENKKSEHKEDAFPTDIKLPVKHVLSRELQLYFDKITELTVSRSDSVLFKEALVSLATDSGLHPLVPYFTYFIADEVTRSLNDFQLLFALMRVVRSLLQNPHIHIEPYLHQMMPSVITCLVAKRLGNRFTDNHWELRDFTAKLVASICKRFGHVYHNLQPRVTRTLLHAFLDPTKSLTQHYGAIQGLAALGPSVVRLLVLPNLEPYLQLLEPEMLLEKQKNEMKRHEAWRVYGALLCAAGQCMYDRLKLCPGLLTPRTNAVFRTNSRVATKMPMFDRHPGVKVVFVCQIGGMNVHH
ncbi:transcription initiation factor TFIID subunit 6 isoform X2 [Macadamia integrifolia]|uniref:transcription initiation factor TFIID subunit 6 isoform X2 n=1 Tax=Macadamia integrifolia TaxID=60698 RepID=UPI001C529FE3|nr:transcription initiation factor TFIID subunit 6 isoform X2 [Macadamia integrifolia]